MKLITILVCVCWHALAQDTDASSAELPATKKLTALQCFEKAQAYLDNSGTKKPSISQAIYWMKRAATGGIKEAKLSLGKLYDSGHLDLPPNPTKAMYWLLKAATEDNMPEAQHLLGIIFAEGRIVKSSKKDVQDCILLARQEGISAADWNLWNGNFIATQSPPKQSIISRIYQYHSWSQIRKLFRSKCVNDNTLVVLDVDQVLLVTRDPLGHPAGQFICRSIMSDTHMNYSEEEKRAMSEKMMCSLEYEMLAPDIPETIRLLTNKGTPVVALTAINMEMKTVDALEWRIGLLDQFDLHFDAQTQPDIRVDWQGMGGYKNGVIRSGSNSKGKALLHFIETIKKSRPSRIIYVDNNRCSILSVRNMCHELGIDFYGIHFVSNKFDNTPQPLVYVINKQLEILRQTNRIVKYENVSREELQRNRRVSWIGTDESLYQVWCCAVMYKTPGTLRVLWEYAMDTFESPLAEAYIACLYYEGLGGLNKNIHLAQAIALNCWESLVEYRDGSYYARHIIGYMMQLGIGVEKDSLEARYWFEKAMLQQHAPSYCAAGQILVDGRWRTPDWAEAMPYFTQAASLGDQVAQQILAWKNIQGSDSSELPHHLTCHLRPHRDFYQIVTHVGLTAPL